MGAGTHEGGGWRIELLGGLRAGSGPQPLTPLPPGKPAALLAYLAFYPQQAHPRETLIELLWPECDPEAGRLRLRVTLHELRRLLGTSGAAPAGLVAADRLSVTLDAARVATDVAAFRAALHETDRAPTPAARGAPLARAVALYGGELLPGFFEPWVLSEREHLTATYLEALRQLVQAREECGDLAAALAAAQQAVKVDPLREEAHHDLMRLYAATGQPAACLRQYEELEQLLREELGETPSVEARALAEELRAQARTLVVVRRPARVPARSVPRPRPLRGTPPSPPSPLPPRLPVQLTRFFGREAETAQLAEWLTSGVTRLVTLTGPGGSGKTRLAIAVAGRLQELFGDDMAFVPLADLTDAARIPDAVGEAVGFDRSPEMEAMEALAAHLADRPWLVVLDNCEHLVEDGALLVRKLLERIPTLTCLVTSRQRLGLGGEQEFALLPLPTPRRSDAFERLRDYASVQLFVDRARAAHADFQLTELNAGAVGELCDRLEGLPLALELAAARAGVLSADQMLAQLEQRFAFLVSRQRDVPARHRTLRAAIDSSYQLLDPELRQFFARLSVFRGGWTLEAAQAVCDEPRTLDFLEQLRDYSLIGVEERGRRDPTHLRRVTGAGMRYRLLETLREYGGEQLTASGELAAVRKRHRDWYLQFAAQSAAAAHGPDQAAWLTRLEAELDNLRAVLAWCQEEADAHPNSAAAEAGLRLADALWWLWMRRGYLTEGLQWLEGALARGSELPAALRAPAFHHAAHLADGRGHRQQSQSLLQAARHEHEKLLTLARTAGDHSDVAHAVLALAYVTDQMYDVDTAWSFGDEARQRMEALGDRVGLAQALEVMAGAALRRGDRQAARPLLEERLAICRELGDSDLLIHALGGLGHLVRDEGDYGRARSLYEESLALRRKLSYSLALAQSLEDLAVLAGREQQHERAVRLLGAAEAFCETLGARPPLAVVAEYERTVAEGRAALGEAAFAAAWAEGRAMSLEQAVEYALDGA